MWPQPYFFTTTAAKNSKAHEFKIKDLAESTARAQGFLEFDAIKNAKGQTFNLIDGGNVENNPAELAYYHARSLYPDDNIIVISISTGDLRSSIDAKNMYGGGLAEWVAPTINLQMGVHSLLVDWRMSQLLSDNLEGDQFYVRIDKHLTDADADLDFTNVSPENIQNLKAVGREVVAGYRDVLDELVLRLRQVKAERDAASRNWKKTKRVGVVKQASESFAEAGQVQHKRKQELYHSFRRGVSPSGLYMPQHAPKSKAQPVVPQVNTSSDDID
jgi:patatin-like phospholipase/acyl hydrolase